MRFSARNNQRRKMHDWRQILFDMAFMVAAFLLLLYIALNWVSFE